MSASDKDALPAAAPVPEPPSGDQPTATLVAEDGILRASPVEGGAALSVSHWDRYEILEPLGRGGMGEVYKARDRRLGRLVALKFIRGADPGHAMRFLQEARAQARIDHPHVCQVHEVGEVAGRAYIAMQLVAGKRLDVAAASLSLPEKVRVMREVALAIHEAHRLGVIHRDLKPSNIMVARGEDGAPVPVVMDFGLAHELDQGHGLTETGALLGTPAYMAPEQARGDVRSIDRRSDVYSLGATLYELLTGVPPFTDATLVGMLAKVLHEEPLPLRARVPQLASDLETLTLKCLSKEPDQRYASARALAEDLGRYLDGEPILGQRPDPWTVLRRRARKHRALVTVSGVSLAFIVALGFIGARSWLEARHTRQQSAGRAMLAERLGQQVKALEGFLRTAYALPLHDTSREQQLVRERMARLAAQPHDLGDTGEALVHYALGRGHLVLLELEQAHVELERARAKGLDSPELHEALGRVLGEQYHRGLEDARRSGDKAWVTLRQRELEARYLAPALQSLERSQGLELESPRYLEGLIAFYRKDYDAAAHSAARAVEEAPWMDEARRLAGDVAYARAMEQLERGEYEAARAGLSEAGRLYALAAEAGRSDARNHEALAEVWLQQSEVDRRQGRSRRESLKTAREAVDRALVAAPLRASGYTRKAYILMNAYRAARFEGSGGEPKSLLAEWLATAERAGTLDPRDAYALVSLGEAQFLRGFQAVSDGRDPSAAWDEAILWLGRALALQPEHPWAHNDLGMVYRWKGSHQQEHGQDPRGVFAEAERCFERATRADPDYLFAHANLADLGGTVAAFLASRGLSPDAEARKALQAAERALSLDPNFFPALNHAALAELTSARFLADSGGDARPGLARAFQFLERSRAINPSFGRTSLLRAMGHHLAALQAMREGRDPTAALADGRRALAEASRLDLGCVDCRVVGTRLELTAAAWATREGRDARPLLAQARAEARRAVAMHPYVEAHQELARVSWRLAEAQAPGSAREALTEGLAQVELALRLDPELADAHALRGALLLARGRATVGTTERVDMLRQAQTALARAFALNPLLRRQYEAPWREVEAEVARGGPGGSVRQ